jgi:hypothetical protein
MGVLIVVEVVVGVEVGVVGVVSVKEVWIELAFVIQGSLLFGCSISDGSAKELNFV